MIRIQNLHKFFNKGRQNEIHVINDVSLELPESGMVAIFGKSGCGKTTLLNVIGGLDRYASGSLTVEGRDIRENTDVIRNRYIGYIFQNYNLQKSETCFDNVADALRLCGMTDPDQIEARVMAALANVGMEKYSKRTPDTLSGGQQQRIAIARAIVKNPHIILADEPTGNLDEANTVMIMDLLKAISKDHLVLLVTHEANLVDYYCDTVIELSDGRVADVKTNSLANGFAARDKNNIYLGELTKSTLSNANAEIEYYGDAPNTPIKLKIVNSGGKIYVEVGTEKVQILDASSEVKLRDGVYEEQANQKAAHGDIDMSALPPISGTRFGRLFTFKSSLKSGYEANFKNRKKGKKVLRGCMCLFAAVVVLMTAVFGTSFGDIIDASNAYNHNVFYLYTPTADVSKKLNEAVGQEASGIDYVRLSGTYQLKDSTVVFRTGSFETFSQYDYESNFKTNAVYLDVSLAKNLSLVEGKKEGLSVDEILISTKVADALLEKSTLGYISERRDLIGLISSMFTVDGRNLRIAGIVDSNEPAVYLTELAMAKYVQSGIFSILAKPAVDYGIELKAGETILAIKNMHQNVKYPRVGETVTIHGRKLTVTAIKEAYYDYGVWLEANNIKKLDEYNYFYQLVKTENPTLSEDSDPFFEELERYRSERYFTYYDYYYSDVDTYLRDYFFFEPSDINLWLYLEKGIEDAKYLMLSEEYYKATVYRNRFGTYPTRDELAACYEKLPYSADVVKPYVMAYENEFYAGGYASSFYGNVYLVSNEDYIAFSKQIGETSPSAINGGGYASLMPDIQYDYVEEASVSVSIGGSTSNDVAIDVDGTAYNTVIHSTDPQKTQSWLSREFPDLCETGMLRTPDDIFDSIIENQMETIITGLITMAVILVLMSLCMYFIMRSSLMNRIKEVGIWRAIGVSKKNLVFRFFVEAVVLTTLTVLLGYLLTSGFLLACLGISSLVSDIFYYPLWLAGAVLGLLYLLGLFFGTLPILSLLRKTPSEILAKYDI